MTRQQSQRGFIALISTIVICAILLALMASADIGSFYARSDASGLENTDTARALAESCVNVALLALATSSDPAHYGSSGQGAQLVQVGVDDEGTSMTCIIKDAISNGTSMTIDTAASSGDSFVGVSAVVSLPPDIRILSWRGAE